MALQLMRENMKYLKWVLWLVIIAFVALFGMDYQPGSFANARVAATVGDEEVLVDEVRNEHQRLEEQYRQIFGEQYNSEMASRFNLIGQALQRSIQRKIMLLEARDLGLEVTNEELRKEILSYPWLQDENGVFIGQEAYTRRLRRARLTPDAFERSVREQILLNKLNTVLTQTVYVSDREAEAIYRRQAERATIRFVQLPASRYTDLPIAPDEIETYFDAHQTDYEIPEQRTVDYLLIDALALRREIEIPVEELQAYYDAHPDELSNEERVRARHILLQVTPERSAEQAEQELAALRQRIEAGEDFAALASSHSDEPDSASRGGSLGLFGRDAWGEDFTQIVFDAEIGSLIGPVRTQYGFHLIEIEDHVPGGVRPFSAVRGQIEARLLTERANELAESRAQDLGTRIGTEATMTAEELAALAEAEGLKVETTKPFGENDVVPGIGRGAFATTAFAMATDQVSAPVKVPRGWAILRLAAVHDPRVPNLEEVEARVRPMVLREKQKEAALDELRTVRAEIEAGGDLEQAAAELGVELKTSEELTAGATVAGLGRAPEVVDTALTLAAGDLGGPFADSQGGAVLFEVVERKSFDPEEFAAQKEETRSGEEAQRLSKLQSSMIELRMRDLEIHYNEDAMEIFGLGGMLAGQG